MGDQKVKAGKRNKKYVLGGISLFIVLVLLGLTHDIIITNILAYRICKADPNPKTFIKKTVDYPESIYWEDNIYPGFDEQDRLLMIRNYLDGEHLKTMALNAPDGTIYLFTATPEDWQTSRQIKAKKHMGNYYDMMEKEAKAIEERGTTITWKSMPKMNYKVVFNLVKLSDIEQKYLYSDSVTIRDNMSDETIAYNHRLMRYYYTIEPEPVGGCVSMTRLYYKSIFGMPIAYGLDDDVILKYNNPSNLLTNYKCKRSLINKL